MWGTFLSEPLTIVATVGRYPAVQLIVRIPIRGRNLSCGSDALSAQHPVLIRLSPGYPGPAGRLDTRYAPVRRSPPGMASHPSAAPRLACVKPVASVHPEPGSNSTLYNLFYFAARSNSPSRKYRNGRQTADSCLKECAHPATLIQRQKGRGK